jgi:uncharacterized repeat protein (TIGR01451 family)
MTKRTIGQGVTIAPRDLAIRRNREFSARDQVMSLNAWKQWFTAHRTAASSYARGSQRRLMRRFRPQVEALEERWLPALTINLTGAATQVAAGRNLTYTMQLSTDSADRLVVLDDLLPANTTFVSASQTAGATQFQALLPPVGGSGRITFRATSLPAQETDTFQFTIHFNADTPPGPVADTARVTSQNVPAPGNASTFTVEVLADPPAFLVTGVPVCAAASVPLTNVPVATFVAIASDAPPSGFSASIDWGDGTPATQGTIVQNGNSFTVLGSHTYALEGAFLVTVTVSDTFKSSGNGTTTASVGGFVTSLYHNLLDRAPDPTGLAAWQRQLQAGASRELVAYGFWLSSEHHGVEVDQFYATFLHRAADAAGRAGWVSALDGGVPESTVAIGFLTSNEYTASHPDNLSYLTGVFTDVLGGITNPSLFSTLEIALATGTRTRAAVAYYVLSSTDAQQQAIDEYYQVFLGRGPSPQEDQTLISLIVSGQETPGLAAASVLGTPEYLARVLAMACMS